MTRVQLGIKCYELNSFNGVISWCFSLEIWNKYKDINNILS